MIYLILFILDLLFIYLNKYLDKSQRKGCLWFMGICLVLVFGLRFRVGLDTITYMDYFEELPKFDEFAYFNFLESHFEPGYVFINALGREISWEFWPVQMIFATITNSGILIFFYRYTKNPFIAIAIYFFIGMFYFSCEIMRESAAIAVFLWNFKNLEEKHWLKYYLISLISISFHFSAIIIWLFPLVRYLRLNVWFVLTCILFLAITPVIESVSNLIQIYSITQRIDHYVEGAQELNLNWRISLLIRNALPPLWAICFFKYSKESILLKQVLLLQILLCAGAFAIPIIFQRFSNYTLMFTVISLANIIIGTKRKPFLKFFTCLIIIGSQAFFLSNLYKRWIPYSSYINPTYVQEREIMWYEEFKE